MRRHLPEYACELAGTAVMLVALTDAQLGPFTSETFGRIFEEDPDRAQALMRPLAGRLPDANRRLAG